MSNLNWLYDSCASWLDAKHKTDFHARDDRLKLVAAANDKGLTVEQVSETIHQVNEAEMLNGLQKTNAEA